MTGPRFTLLVALLCAGCATPTAERPLSLKVPSDWRPAAPPGEYGFDPADALAELRRGRPPERPPTRHVLAVSAGGKYGAYPAGLLAGWTATGTRPAFDVVTGVSTGALIAPFAFLGTGYDAQTREQYTQVESDDIFRFRWPLALLWSESVADSTPLRDRLDAAVTPALLARVAEAHAAGRRLYVGTCNLETKRLVVWDMGAIAADARPGRRELFRDVLLASCSIPGVFPSVPLRVGTPAGVITEYHGDGAVAASLFVEPYMLGPDPAAARVYALVSGRLVPEPSAVERRLLSVAREAATGVLQTRTEGDIMRIFLAAHLSGASFRLAAIPPEVPLGGNSLEFEPESMRELYAAGYRAAVTGDPWRQTPPCLERREQRVPRSGADTCPTP